MRKTGCSGYIIVGLGSTGLSCVNFLTQHETFSGVPLTVMDTRENPPNLDKFRQQYPDIPVYTGANWPQTLLNLAKAIIISPGVDQKHSALVQAKKNGVSIIGDIELFAQVNQIPVIAITGANGKSTVTTLVGEMAKGDGKKVAVIGNIGIPALTLFEKGTLLHSFDFIVMELSSFQLETTYQLNPLAATVLNITPDHLDRYEKFEDYVFAKHQIYSQAKNVIINRDDPLSDSPRINRWANRFGFTLSEPQQGEFGLRKKGKETWLAYEEKYLLPTHKMKLVGQHNIANALSALALGSCAGLSLEAMLATLTTFAGLDHRCQWVVKNQGVTWINDSKGTNIGACQAALHGLSFEMSGKIVLLLGGDGKGADFTALRDPIRQYCRSVIVMGKDGLVISQALQNLVPVFQAMHMQEAISIAKNIAIPEDIVLLSPACSSLDQYRDFAHRGETFMALVKDAYAV